MAEWLIPIATAIVAASGTLFTVKRQNKKTEAEGADILVGAALALVDPLKRQVDQLEQRVEALERERRIDRELVGMLTQQLLDNKIEPVTRSQAKERLGVLDN